MAGGFVCVCFGAGFRGSIPPPARTARSAVGRRRLGSRSGLCVRGGGAGGAAPSPATGLPSPRRPQPPRSPRGRSAAAARAGRARGRLRHTLAHTLTHTHTYTRAHAPARLHLVLFHRPTHGRSRVSPCQRSPHPSPSARARQVAAPPVSSAASGKAPRPRPFGRCSYCRDVEAAEGARWRHAYGTYRILDIQIQDP
ncbi:Ddb1- And Cul4-Associated Factor 1 [Manis pentadactyla]|nr:Ddb1- And Cul4-Associated Factor 1 [Manis pentadactyla]